MLETTQIYLSHGELRLLRLEYSENLKQTSQYKTFKLTFYVVSHAQWILSLEIQIIVFSCPPLPLPPPQSLHLDSAGGFGWLLLWVGKLKRSFRKAAVPSSFWTYAAIIGEEWDPVRVSASCLFILPALLGYGNASYHPHIWPELFSLCKDWRKFGRSVFGSTLFERSIFIGLEVWK